MYPTYLIQIDLSKKVFSCDLSNSILLVVDEYNQYFGLWKTNIKVRNKPLTTANESHLVLIEEISFFSNLFCP